MIKESCRYCLFQGGYDNTPICRIDENKILDLEIVKNNSSPDWCKINKRIDKINKLKKSLERLKKMKENCKKK